MCEGEENNKNLCLHAVLVVDVLTSTDLRHTLGRCGWHTFVQLNNNNNNNTRRRVCVQRNKREKTKEGKVASCKHAMQRKAGGQ